MNSINNWLLSNKLTLNVAKSHYLIFSRNKSIPSNILPIKINDKILDLKKSTNYLGLNIQNNLKWDNHVNYISNKLHKFNSILYLTRDYLNRSSLLSIYHSLVYSCLSFSNIIWGKTSQRNTNKLIRDQKKIIRTIMYRNRSHHTCADFQNLEILNIKNINKYFAGIFVYKSLHNLCYPQNYFFTSDHFINNYNLGNSNNLRPPHARTNQGQSSPSIYCCHVWNVIPYEIRTKPSVPSFKFALRRHLLNS